MLTFKEILCDLRSNQHDEQLQASNALVYVDFAVIPIEVICESFPILITFCSLADNVTCTNCVMFIGQIFEHHTSDFSKLLDSSLHTALLTALVKLLGDQRSDVREMAAWTLLKIDPSTLFALPGLIDTLTNTDPQIRLTIARLLARGSYKASLSLTQSDMLQCSLKRALRIEDDYDVRRELVIAMGDIAKGSPSKQAIQSLIWVLEHDRGKTYRKWAANALGCIGPRAEVASSALLQSLGMEDEASEVRQECASALGKIGANASEVVPALVKALKCRSEDVRLSAAISLGLFGAEAAIAVPELTAALEDRDAGIRNLALDCHSGVRYAAAEALGIIGEHAESAWPALLHGLSDPNAKVRGVCREALRTLLSASIPKAITMFLDEDSDFQEIAADTLKSMGQEVVPTVFEMLQSDDEATRTHAMTVVAAIDANAFPDVVQMLQDKADSEMKYRANLAMWDVEASLLLPQLKILYLVGVLYREGEDSFRKVDSFLQKNCFNEVTLDGMPFSHVALRDNIKSEKLALLFCKVLGCSEFDPLVTPKGFPTQLTSDAYRAWDWTDAFLRRHLSPDWFGFAVRGK